MNIISEDGKRCSIYFSDDDMEAYIRLEKPESGGVEYTKEDISGYLESANVCFGIKESRISAIIKKRMFRKEVLIAEGERSVNGTDGYFEYYFDDKPNLNKPHIRDDGTVDYTAMNVIRCVKKGDIIAAYFPAKQGKEGISVKGERVKARPAKELPRLLTKGVTYDGETHTYIAERSGRVELSKSRISVEDIQEFYRDIDSVYGSINFYGDVIIHGNVKSGISITATKSVSIDGTLEASDITAGEDVIVKGGILGNYSARIKCGGTLYADFIEYAKIDAGENISANSFLDCEVTACGEISATGKNGAIIGGNVYGMQRVECIYAGNDAQVKTVISAGIKGNMLKEKETLEKRIRTLREELNDFSKRDIEFERLSKLGTIDEVSLGIWKRMRENQVKDTEELGKSLEKLRILNGYINGADDPRVIVHNTLFSGSFVQLGSQQVSVRNDMKGAEFYLNGRGQMAW